jgi:hypothetical protein
VPAAAAAEALLIDDADKTARIFAPELDPEAPLEEQIATLRLLIVTTPPGSPAKLYRISPALAGWILKNLNLGKGYGNRRFRPRKIAELIDAIKRGYFIVTGDTIKFGQFEEGALAKGMGLLDGQNRLSAIAQAGRIVATYIVFGIDSNAFRYIDVGAIRTGGDTFVTYGVAKAGPVSAATRWLKIFEQHQPPEPPNRGLSMTNDELWKYYENGIDQERLQSCVDRAKLATGKVIPVGLLAALFYRFVVRDLSCAEHFIQDLTIGMRGAGELIKRFQKLKKAGGRLNENDYVGQTLLCWNEYRAGRTRVSGRFLAAWDLDKPFPTIK